MNLDKIVRKYRENALLKILIRPLWRRYVAYQTYRHNKQFRKKAIFLLYKIKEALDANSVFFWLEYGTLLGAYRNHDFISYDYDMDMGVFYEDASRVREALVKNGFKLNRQFKVADGSLGFQETYTFLGVDIDIFYFHKELDTIYCNGFKPLQEEPSYAQVKKVTFPYKGFTTIIFKDKPFNVPANIEEHLAAHYGEDFMIPKANFDSQKAPNVYYYSLSERKADYMLWE